MDKYIAIIVILLGVQTSVIVSEPICSKYDYDEKTLQKLIRLEFKFERLMDNMESFKGEWNNVKSDVNTKMESMSTLLNGVNEKITTEFEEWKNRKTDLDTKFENMSMLLNGVNERMTNESEEWKNRKTDVDTKMEDMSTLLNGVNERMTNESEEWKNRKTDVDTKLENMSTLLNGVNKRMKNESEEWKNRNTDLDTKFENMSRLLNGVNERMTNESEEWKNRKTDVDTKFENLSRLLNGVNERMTNESEEWKNRKTDLDTKLKDMSTLLNGVNESNAREFEKSKMVMEQLSTRLTKGESSGAIIAFSATNLEDVNPANGHTMVFKEINFNVGGGYDANTGTFTAPEGGFYLFLTHVCNFDGKSVFYAVINDGTEVLRSVQADDKYYSCHSIPVVTHVRSGGEVKVQSTNSASQLKQHSFTRPMFSGVLLNHD